MPYRLWCVRSSGDVRSSPASKSVNLVALFCAAKFSERKRWKPIKIRVVFVEMFVLSKHQWRSIPKWHLEQHTNETIPIQKNPFFAFDKGKNLLTDLHKQVRFCIQSLELELTASSTFAHWFSNTEFALGTHKLCWLNKCFNLLKMQSVWCFCVSRVRVKLLPRNFLLSLISFGIFLFVHNNHFWIMVLLSRYLHAFSTPNSIPHRMRRVYKSYYGWNVCNLSVCATLIACYRHFKCRYLLVYLHNPWNFHSIILFISRFQITEHEFYVYKMVKLRPGDLCIT